MATVEKILEVQDLAVEFKTDRGRVRALDGVQFDVWKGKTLGIVGESGSGKSVSALSIMRLIPNPPGEIIQGKILYRGNDLLELPWENMRALRGNKISMIFQEPMTALNPVFTVGNQIEETFKLHKKGLSRSLRREKAIEFLHLVGIPSPETRVDEYPHQMSGGMRQRVAIAMSLACNPEILIADEPTTALDVTIQAQILDLMRKLQKDLGMGIIMITHDLGVIAETCDYVAVMYCGRIVETADVHTLFKNPRHPYTQGLLNSIPSLKRGVDGKVARLVAIEGMVPSLFELPEGCNFQDRCNRVTEECRIPQGDPQLEEKNSGHFVACGESN